MDPEVKASKICTFGPKRSHRRNHQQLSFTAYQYRAVNTSVLDNMEVVSILQSLASHQEALRWDATRL